MKSATLRGRCWFIHVHSTSDCILTCASTMAGAYCSTEQHKPHASGAWDHSMSMHEALVIYLTTRRGHAKSQRVAHLIRQYTQVAYSGQQQARQKCNSTNILAFNIQHTCCTGKHKQSLLDHLPELESKTLLWRLSCPEKLQAPSNVICLQLVLKLLNSQSGFLQANCGLGVHANHGRQTANSMQR